VCDGRVRAGARIRDARHCTWHRGDMEVDLRHVRCRHAEGCERRAQFGVKAGGRTMPQFCGAHRLPHHHDATHRACAAPGCRSRALFGNATIGACPPSGCAALPRSGAPREGRDVSS